MDLFLNVGTRDVDVSEGLKQIRFTNGQLETVRQRLQIKLQFFLGEYFLDTRIGVPFYRDVLVKNPNLSLIQALFTRVVQSDPDVESVQKMNVELGEGRSLLVSFDALLIDRSIPIVALAVAPVLSVGGDQGDPFIILF